MAIEVPTTLTLTNHGLMIVASNGQPVGAISDWNSSHNQVVTPVYAFTGTPAAPNDLEAERGEPYENVPGNDQNMKIAVTRYDLVNALLESAFGTRELQMLSRQDQPFTCREFWATPGGTLDFHWIYYGCWFDNLGRTLSASNDRIVKVAGSLTYTRRRKL